MVSSSILLALLVLTGDAKSPAKEPTAAERYKNIQVLKDVPASEIDSLMAVMSGSLGVDCHFCHGDTWESEENHTKNEARDMLRLTFALQKESFEGKPEVTCWTCHRGHDHPETVPAVGKIEHRERGRGRVQNAPQAADLFDAFAKAIGGADAVKAVTTRVVTASHIGENGVSEPEIVKLKAPGKMLVTRDGPPKFIMGCDGEKAWFSDGEHTDLLGKAFADSLRREARFQDFGDLKARYPNARVAGKDVIGDEETDVWVVEASKRGEPRERLFFDVDSGLLVRQTSEERTILGPLPTQIDYDDYRDVNGVKVPFVVQWSTPGQTWRRIVQKVEHGASIDDAEFAMPAAKK